MKRGQYATLAAVGSAAMLAACGGDKSAQAAPQRHARQAAGASAPRPPARPAEPPYYMPPEWMAQLRTGRLLADPAYLQGLAMYLYQNQAWALDKANNATWLTALFSCDDGVTSNNNEIVKPAAHARTVAALQRFFAAPPRAGNVMVTGFLGQYDTSAQMFGWQVQGRNAPTFEPDNIVLNGARTSCGAMTTGTGRPTDSGLMLTPVPGRIVVHMAGASLPALHVPTDQANTFIQNEGAVRAVQVTIVYGVPPTSGGTVRSDAYGVGSGVGDVHAQFMDAGVEETGFNKSTLRKLGN